MQWRPDDDSESATRFQQVKTFVDEHSFCDFSIHHQTTTDRLIIRRHDRSVPITMEMGEWLIAEVETGQLTVLQTPPAVNLTVNVDGRVVTVPAPPAKPVPPARPAP